MIESNPSKPLKLIPAIQTTNTDKPLDNEALEGLVYGRTPIIIPDEEFLWQTRQADIGANLQYFLGRDYVVLYTSAEGNPTKTGFGKEIRAEIPHTFEERAQAQNETLRLVNSLSGREAVLMALCGQTLIAQFAAMLPGSPIEKMILGGVVAPEGVRKHMQLILSQKEGILSTITRGLVNVAIGIPSIRDYARLSVQDMNKFGADLSFGCEADEAAFGKLSKTPLQMLEKQVAMPRDLKDGLINGIPEEQIRKISASALILAGEHSKTDTPDHQVAQMVASLFTSATIHTIPGAPFYPLGRETDKDTFGQIQMFLEHN